MEVSGTALRKNSETGETYEVEGDQLDFDMVEGDDVI